MRFDKLCLVITNRCSAACDFCGFSCSPEGDQVISAMLNSGDWLSSPLMMSNSLSTHSAQYTTGPRSMLTRPLSASTLRLALTVRGCMSKWMPTTSPLRQLRLMVR